MTLLGALIKDGKVEPVKGKSVADLLTDDVCVLIIDDVASIIHIWCGDKANVKDRFMASRLAHGLNGKLFGMAGKVNQQKNVIKETFSEKVFDDDISLEHIKEILG